ncbi:MAG: hypothetical protein WBV89_04480, partial [Ilumatobacter sp.]
MTRLGGPGGLLIASILALAACGGGGSDAEPVDTESQATAPSTDVAETDVAESDVAETAPETDVAETDVAETDVAETSDDTSVDEPTDSIAEDGPVCADFDDALQDYTPVPCDEPHSAEFAGAVTPPAGNLPDDAVEASVLLRELCSESVEALTGRDLTLGGAGVGFVSPSGLGEPMVDDISCWASLDVDGAFTGSIAEDGFDGALNAIVIADLEPGTCFDFFDENDFALGTVVDCGTDGALMAIGTVTASGEPGAPYPGDDALRDERAQLCAELLSESDL